MIPTAIGVSGTYYIKAVDSLGCFDIKPVDVIVNALPPTPVPQNDVYCLNDNTTSVFANVLVGHKLQWYEMNTAGGYLSISNPTPTSSTAGTITYYVSQISNRTGCESPKVNLDVKTNPLPVVTITPSSNPICYGSDLALKGLGAKTYTWDKGITDDTYFKIYASDKYTVTGIDSNGCVNTAFINMTVKELPVATASINPYQLCVGNSFNLVNYVTKGLRPYTFTITPANSNITAATNGSILGVSAGNAQLSYQVKDANGCVSNAISVFYIKISAPVASETFSMEAYINENLLVPTKTDSGYDKYEWTPRFNLNFYDDKNPTFNGEQRVYYTLRRTNPVNNCYVLDNYNITVATDGILLLPNAFTPNTDGLNDKLLVIKNQGILNLNYFKIYNRNGILVFQTSNLAEGWNGKVGSYVQESDSYFWIVEYVTKRGITVKKSGQVLLLK
jgi:gliding motility-associated-like protein